MPRHCALLSSSCRSTLIVVLGLLCTAQTRAATEIRLHDGRTITTQAAPQGTEEELRVSTTAAGVAMQSAFPWSLVAEVRRDGQRVSLDDLRRGVSAPPLADVQASRPVAAPRSASSAATSGRSPRETAEGRIAAIAVSAQPAQWDADAEPDGLLVTIEGRTSTGGPASGRGEVTLSLRGFVRDSFVRDDLALVPQVYELERHYQLVREEDFRDGLAVFRLPFDRVDPLRDLAVEPTCVVHARLGLFGQGVVEGQSGVEIRPWHPLVDRLPYFESGLPPLLLKTAR